VPVFIVQNASWYLRKAGIWPSHGDRFTYPWLTAFQHDEDDGAEGLMQTVAVAAGLLINDGLTFVPDPVAVYTGRWSASHALTPACGTSLALARHHLQRVDCATCEDAAALRHVARAERLAERMNVIRAQRQAKRVTDERMNEEAADRYRALLAEEATERDRSRQRRIQEREELKQAGLNIPQPRMLSLDWVGGSSDRFDPGPSPHEWLADGEFYRDVVPWLDPTFEIVAAALEDHHIRERAARDYQRLVMQSIKVPEGQTYVVNHTGLDHYPGRMTTRQPELYDRSR
jgi:hypothetical protein